MIIHFVCVGNTYRSRLAEAYFNSLNIEDWQATSSGIRAERNLNGDITRYAKDILKSENILSFTTETWTQTTKEVLEEGQLVIFMHPKVHKRCTKILCPQLEAFQVWDIEDIIPDNHSESEVIDTTRKTFSKIKDNINLLVQNKDIFNS